MEANYKIEWLEKIEKFGKPALKVSLSIGGATPFTEDVTIYKFDKDNKEFPGFDSIVPGAEIFGRIYEKNGYKTLYPATPKKAGNGGAFKNHQIKETMNIKREDIANSQERKETGIKIASTFNQACALAIAEFHEQRKLSSVGPTLEQLIAKWREWAWLNWDMDESNEVPPFKN